MVKNNVVFPVVDLFAGPGGLGEGFTSFSEGSNELRFKSAVSIEDDKYSFQTLHLRHFLRSFPNGEFPSEYYQYLRNEISKEDLFGSYPENKAAADSSAVKITLCPQNHEEVRKLISDRIKECKRWVLVGGPPCQAYSLVGRARMKGKTDFEEDERHFLYQEYLKIIIDHAPPVFVMENVKGLLSAKVNERLVVNQIISDLTNPGIALEGSNGELGYQLYPLDGEGDLDLEPNPRSFLVRAEQFGVPQARHRMFIVGVRNDIELTPSRLVPQKGLTMKQMIGDLPAIRSGLSKIEDTLESWRNEISGITTPNFSDYLNGIKDKESFICALRDKLNTLTEHQLETASTDYSKVPCHGKGLLREVYDSQLDFLDGHESRGHMGSDLRRYFFASVFASEIGRSPKLPDFPESLLPYHKNVGLGRVGKMFSDRFRVQLPDKPSTTVTSHISKDGHYFIHYDSNQCRSLTVREAARLQTFPDNYKFEGPRTAQYHQVGNAVPPYLARQIAKIVSEVLGNMEVQST